MRFLHIYWGNRPGPCSSHQALLSATHTPPKELKRPGSALLTNHCSWAQERPSRTWSRVGTASVKASHQQLPSPGVQGNCDTLPRTRSSTPKARTHRNLLHGPAPPSAT